MTIYKNLEAWKCAMEMVDLVYRLCERLPDSEKYILRNQLARASVSVPANIAEGMGRRATKDNLHFLHIARGSLYELETLLELAQRRGYTTGFDMNAIDCCLSSSLKTLNGLIKYYINLTRS
jgi:four helix bundle protein